jgi:hypothetical protein
MRVPESITRNGGLRGMNYFQVGCRLGGLKVYRKILERVHLSPLAYAFPSMSDFESAASMSFFSSKWTLSIFLFGA